MTDSFEIFGVSRVGRWVLTVDHASNAVPADVCNGDLGLPAEDMARHIAYDIGALGVSQRLGTLLDAPVIASRFSRLVIDPNRGSDDPTLVMQLYDGSIIPGNRGLPMYEVERRLNVFYRPYHDAVCDVALARKDPVMLAIHSFTPQFRGRAPRPWHIAILYADDDRLARPLLARLRAEPDLVVGDNEPYHGRLRGDSMDRHGLQMDRPHVLIELRHDLIADAAGQRVWAERLAPILQASLADAGV